MSKIHKKSSQTAIPIRSSDKVKTSLFWLGQCVYFVAKNMPNFSHYDVIIDKINVIFAKNLKKIAHMSQKWHETTFKHTFLFNIRNRATEQNSVNNNNRKKV